MTWVSINVPPQPYKYYLGLDKDGYVAIIYQIKGKYYEYNSAGSVFDSQEAADFAEDSEFKTLYWCYLPEEPPGIKYSL